MGIQDRDYMRRRPEADERRTRYRSSAGKAAGWLGRFFDRHPNFGVWLAVGLIGSILVVVIYAKLTGG